jgi:hypothetical protein
MTNQAVASSNDGEANPAHRNYDDDASEATQTDTRRSKKTAEILIEKTVKFRFLKLDSVHSVDPILFHLHWLQMVQEEFGDSIQVFNNNGGIMQKVSSLHWDAAKHGKIFKAITPDKRNSQFSPARKKLGESKETATFIIHRIRTSLTMTAMKNVEKVRQLLVDNNVFLTEHRWSEDIWDLQRHGFILGLDPQVYNPIQAQEKLRTDIIKRVPKNMKIPKFQVAFCSPKTYQGQTFLKTKAYAIETERKNTVEMVQVLKKAYHEKHEFVPFQMRGTHPDSYARSIQRQTKMMSETRIISMNYFGSDVMFYLSEHIMAIPGVKAIVPAPTFERDGRYRVAVEKPEFNSIRSHLQKNVHTWIEEYVIDDDAMRSLKKYPAPPEIGMIDSDIYSTGEGTYMTESANTAMSYDSVSSDLTNNGESQASASSHTGLPKASSSWAARIRGSMLQSSNPAKVIISPSNVVNDELISDLASSRAEVDELKHQMSQIVKDKEVEKKAYEQQRKEMQLEAAKRKFEYSKHIELQRKELETKLAEQKEEMKAQARSEREELEQSLNEKIAAAIRANNATNPPAAPAPPPPPPSEPSAEITRMFANQERQIQMLSDLIKAMAPHALLSPTEERNQAKRPVEEVDLTADHHNFEHLRDPPIHVSKTANKKNDAERKRRDIRGTPQKKPPTSTLYTSNDMMSPASALSSSIANTPDRRHPSTWISYHRTPETKSTVYGMEETGDDPSDHQHEDDTDTCPPFTPYENAPGIMEDTSITPTQLEDIYAQHEPAENDPSTIENDDIPTEMDTSSTGPMPKDKLDPLPAKPVEEIPTPHHHE